MCIKHTCFRFMEWKTIHTIHSLSKQYPPLNFYDIKDAFNKKWKGKTPKSGMSYKQFKRWEYFMEPRLYPTGEFVNASKMMLEAIHEEVTPFKNLDEQHCYPNANWLELGSKVAANPQVKVWKHHYNEL